MQKIPYKVPSEESEQITLFTWANMQKNNYPDLALMFHIPNGGLRSKSEAKRFKASGVKPGVPDIFLPVPRGQYCGLFIEMKRIKGGRVSEEQSDWISRLEMQGYKCEVCRGWQKAAEVIEKYLEGNYGYSAN